MGNVAGSGGYSSPARRRHDLAADESTITASSAGLRTVLHQATCGRKVGYHGVQGHISAAELRDARIDTLSAPRRGVRRMHSLIGADLQSLPGFTYSARGDRLKNPARRAARLCVVALPGRQPGVWPGLSPRHSPGFDVRLHIAEKAKLSPGYEVPSSPRPKTCWKSDASSAAEKGRIRIASRSDFASNRSAIWRAVSPGP